jgi:hypothetical protein
MGVVGDGLHPAASSWGCAVRTRKRDAELRPAEPTPSPPASARIVSAQRPLLVCTPSLGADGALPVGPGNDARPPAARPARSGLKPGDVVVDLPVERIISDVDADGGQCVVSAAHQTPDEVEAIAQRLAALLLRGA